jgi:phosphoglycolate phosphatase
MEKDSVLIFDFDGTIADTFHYVLKIGNRLSEEFHFNKITEDEINDMKDMNFLEIIQHLNVPLLKIPMIVAKAKKELHKEIASVEPIEGLKEILPKIKSLGHKIGILTSNSSKNVMEFLKNNELDFFDFINTTSKIWSKNWSLQNIIDDLGLEISNVIYIGDETRDIAAAKRAGIRSAAVTWGYNSCKALQAQDPDYLLHSPEELFQLFT